MSRIICRGKHVHVFPENAHLDGVWVTGYQCAEDYIAPIKEDGISIDLKVIF